MGLNFGPRLDHLLHGLSEAFPRSVGNAGEADSSDLFSINLSAHKDQALARCPPPSFAGFDAADKGFIDFHDTRQAVSPGKSQTLSRDGDHNVGINIMYILGARRINREFAIISRLVDLHGIDGNNGFC
jgi:hypothetical protein